MTIFITFGYVITFRCSHLRVLISKLIQSKSALFSAENPMFQSYENQLLSDEFLSSEHPQFREN